MLSQVVPNGNISKSDYLVTFRKSFKTQLPYIYAALR